MNTKSALIVITISIIIWIIMAKTETSDLSAAEKVYLAIDMQLKDDKWKYDEYNFGVMAGLLCAFEAITGEPVKHFERPKAWLKDLEEDDETSVAPFSLKEKKVMDV